MATVLNENIQYLDTSGKPLTGGKIYIGDVDVDPVANLKSIFSDRELTVSLANPQTIDSKGRATTKIWLGGTYSIQVNDINGVQVFQDLDRGNNATAAGVVSLASVIGGNTITATASPTITAYVDKLLYTFKAAQANTGAATLNIDGVGAKAIVKDNNIALASGDIAANLNYVVSYNSTGDNFAITNLINQKTEVVDDLSPQLGGKLDTNAQIIRESIGTAQASASTVTPPTNGNIFHLTTGTGPITGFTNGDVGQRHTIIPDVVVSLTNSSTLVIEGAADYTTVVGTSFDIIQDTATIWRVVVTPAPPTTTGFDPSAVYTDKTSGFVLGTSYQNTSAFLMMVLGSTLNAGTWEVSPDNSVWTVADATGATDRENSSFIVRPNWYYKGLAFSSVDSVREFV